MGSYVGVRHVRHSGGAAVARLLLRAVLDGKCGCSVLSVSKALRYLVYGYSEFELSSNWVRHRLFVLGVRVRVFRGHDLVFLHIEYPRICPGWLLLLQQ